MRHVILGACLTVLLSAQSFAAVLDSITPTNSTFVRSNNPTGDVQGNNPAQLHVKFKADGSPIGDWNRKTYLRYELDDINLDEVDITPSYMLDLTLVDSTLGSTGSNKQWDFTLYGFVESGSTNFSTMTWNTAPENDVTSGSSFLSGATELANFAVLGKGLGDLWVSDSRLNTFVNNNLDTSVIFAIGRDTPEAGADTYVHAVLGGGSSPVLKAVPAPSVFVGLLSLVSTGSFAFVVRRRLRS